MSDENTFVCPMRGFRNCVGNRCMWAIKYPDGRNSCSVSQIAVDIERLACAFGAGGGTAIHEKRDEVE